MINYRPALLLLLLTGCNLMPTFELKSGEIPQEWRHADNAPAAADIPSDWWRQFGSAELNTLIELALANNNDLAAAEQRIKQARAQAKMAGASLWPQAGISAAYSASHNDLGESRKQSLDLPISYEVDLWAANRGRRDAGQARWLSEVFARDALRLVVMAEVSQSYFTVLAAHERKRIAEAFLGNVDDVLNIVEARLQVGAVSALDLAQQRTERANAQASLEASKQQLGLAENALTILLGRAPRDLPSLQGQFAELMTPSIPPQQPASLLQRRPDLRQAEMLLQAANLDVGIANAQFYPSLKLNLDTLLANPQPAGIALSMASSLTQPLFQGGRLQGGLRNAEGKFAELQENYQQSLLNALKEVEDAAAIRNQSGLRLLALREAVASAQAAYQLSSQRYRVGAIDYQTLLNTQRSLLNSQNDVVQGKLDQLRALAQLYKALGGGWQQG